MRLTGLNQKQLTNWFTNARKRIWQPITGNKQKRQKTGSTHPTAMDMPRSMSTGDLQQPFQTQLITQQTQMPLGMSSSGCSPKVSADLQQIIHRQLTQKNNQVKFPRVCLCKLNIFTCQFFRCHQVHEASSVVNTTNGTPIHANSGLRNAPLLPSSSASSSLGSRTSDDNLEVLDHSGSMSKPMEASLHSTDSGDIEVSRQQTGATQSRYAPQSMADDVAKKVSEIEPSSSLSSVANWAEAQNVQPTSSYMVACAYHQLVQVGLSADQDLIVCQQLREMLHKGEAQLLELEKRYLNRKDSSNDHNVGWSGHTQSQFHARLQAPRGHGQVQGHSGFQSHVGNTTGTCPPGAGGVAGLVQTVSSDENGGKQYAAAVPSGIPPFFDSNELTQLMQVLR
jgi:hypothetical protein